MSDRIVWWEVETFLVEAFQEFHGAMWGWGFRPAFAGTELDRDYWIIQSGPETIGGLQRALEPEMPRAGTRFYLIVEDLEATLARAVGLGATVERGRTELGGDDRWFANITDPAGVSMGLWTSAPPT